MKFLIVYIVLFSSISSSAFSADTVRSGSELCNILMKTFGFTEETVYCATFRHRLTPDEAAFCHRLILDETLTIRQCVYPLVETNLAVDMLYECEQLQTTEEVINCLDSFK
jgi:hypothetical protein